MGIVYMVVCHQCREFVDIDKSKVFDTPLSWKECEDWFKEDDEKSIRNEATYVFFHFTKLLSFLRKHDKHDIEMLNDNDDRTMLYKSGINLTTYENTEKPYKEFKEEVD